MDTLHKIPVKMANGSTSSFITGVGSVVICNEQDSSERRLIKNVFLCDTLRHSLLSGITLRDSGADFESRGSGIDIKFQDGEVVTANRKGRKWVVRVLEFDVETEAATVGNFMLWHRRLGHPNEKVLRKMIRDEVCVGLPRRLTKTTPCEE